MKDSSEGGSNSLGESFQFSAGESKIDSSLVLTDVTVLDSPKPYTINSSQSLPYAENKSYTLQA
jgi:hypothetical protein